MLRVAFKLSPMFGVVRTPVSSVQPSGVLGCRRSEAASTISSYQLLSAINCHVRPCLSYNIAMTPESKECTLVITGSRAAYAEAYL